MKEGQDIRIIHHNGKRFLVIDSTKHYEGVTVQEI